MDFSMPVFPVFHYLLEFAQTHVHWISDVIQPSHPLSPPSPPAFIFPSIMVFSNELLLCIRCPKYWNFSISISSSNEYSGMISFRIDWFDLHSSRDSQEFSPTSQLKTVNSLVLSCLHGPILTSIHDFSWYFSCSEKNIALTRWTFVGKVIFMSLNMLSKLVRAFLPRSKQLLISWLQSQSAVFWSPRK